MKLSEEQIAFYDVAKNFAIEKIRHGVKAKDIDKIARDYIDKKGFGKYFLHSLGHGVGIEVHESPILSPLSEDILEEGMVFTIEPGIYIEGEFGIRLEDMVTIMNGEVNLLTELSENFQFKEF
jgi:Xaa-Pro aminopeptidase